jgi:hypothetical protein
MSRTKLKRLMFVQNMFRMSNQYISECIWCRECAPSTLSHIIPESLGCPSWFVMTEGVCGRCNNGFGKLEQALLKPHELATVLFRVPRKGGKPATIDSHSSFASAHGEAGPELYINRSRDKVAMPSGKMLMPTSKRDVLTEFILTELDNSRVEVTLEQTILFCRNAVRALFKSALETLAFLFGVDFVLEKRFDPIRDFVRANIGDRHAAMLIGDGRERVGWETRSDGTGLNTVFILGQIFQCDFSSDFSDGRNLIAKTLLQPTKRAIVLPNS